MVFRVRKSGNATGPFEWRGQKGCFEKKKAPSEASVPITIAAFCTEGRSRGRCHLPRSRAGDVPNNLRVSRPSLLLLLTHRQKRQSRKKKEKNTTQNRPGLLAFSIPILVNWTSVILFQIEVNFCLPWSWLWCSAHSKTRHEWQGRTAWGSLSSGGGQKRKPAPGGKYPVRFFFLFLKLCNTVGKLK